MTLRVLRLLINRAVSSPYPALPPRRPSLPTSQCPMTRLHLQKPFKYLKATFRLSKRSIHLRVLYVQLPTSRSHLCRLPLQQNLHSTGTLTVSGLRSLTNTGGGKVNIPRPRSYFARRLFCRCADTYFVSSAFMYTCRLFLMGVAVLSPPRLRQQTAFFSMHRQTGQPCTADVYFLSACTIPAATC